MEKSQRERADWALRKAEEYLASAAVNLAEKRLHPAAEEVFRATETALESMLYAAGVVRIAYPGRGGEFKGRLALQMLARDNLLNAGKITKEDYTTYLQLSADLHQGGYAFGREFKAKELEGYLDFAEKLFKKARGAA
jgi:hypothetical protein